MTFKKWIELWNKTALHMKQKLEKCLMIILNNSGEDIVHWEFLSIKIIYSGYVSINLSSRLKRQPPYDVTWICTVKA